MISLLQRAADLAIHYHVSQKYGSHPYTVHLTDVVTTLQEFNHNDEELLAAAWLHDILEDTDCRVLDLCIAKVPPYTIALVDAVTDRHGANRKERHILTYPRIARMPDAVTLKLADRLANVRASAERRPDLLKMYAGEHLEFITAMPYKDADREMRRELRDLLGGEHA